MQPSPRALAFLSAYKEAFIQRDAAKVASFYAEPMLVYSAGNKVIFQNRQIATTKVQELFAIYGSMGMVDADMLSTETVLREGDIEELFIEWCLYGKDKAKLIAFKTSYTLLHGPEKSECLFAISHNEVGEIKKFFAARAR